MVSFYWIFHLKCKGLYPSVRPSDRSVGRLASPIRVNITRIPTPLPKSIFSNRLQHACIEAQIKILSVSYNFFLEMKPQGFFFFLSLVSTNDCSLPKSHSKFHLPGIFFSTIPSERIQRHRKTRHYWGKQSCRHERIHFLEQAKGHSQPLKGAEWL